MLIKAILITLASSFCTINLLNSNWSTTLRTKMMLIFARWHTTTKKPYQTWSQYN